MFKTQCSGLARIQGISEKEAVECEPKLTHFVHPKSCQFTYRYYPCRPIQLSGSVECEPKLSHFVHPKIYVSGYLSLNSSGSATLGSCMCADSVVFYI